MADSGIVVETRNASALSGALKRMIGLDPAERRRLGSLARLRIGREYSIEIASARFAALYDEFSGRLPACSDAMG